MTEQETFYTNEFYHDQSVGSRKSALKIIPKVLELVGATSIVDVGCGVGTWLHVAKDCGVKDIMGVDGEYVNRHMLEIPAAQFLAHDLLKPLSLDRKFDLVISLEVAEHLPPENANKFVRMLTQLGPVVLFSAAIPYQNGTHHLNEQFQNYWAGIFRSEGYLAVDCIRRHVWNDVDVEPWYAQNAILFVDETLLPKYPPLIPEREATADGFLSVVHPWIYRKARIEAQSGVTSSEQMDQIPLRRIIADLPRRVLRAVARRNKHQHQVSTGTP